MPTLNALPKVMHESISAFLGPSDLGSVRRLSKCIRQNTSQQQLVSTREVLEMTGAVQQLLPYTFYRTDADRDPVLWHSALASSEDCASKSAATGVYFHSSIVRNASLSIMMTNYFTQKERAGLGNALIMIPDGIQLWSRMLQFMTPLIAFLSDMPRRFINDYQKNIAISNELGFLSLNLRFSAFVQDFLRFDDLTIHGERGAEICDALKAEARTLLSVVHRVGAKVRWAAHGLDDPKIDRFLGNRQDAWKLKPLCAFMYYTLLMASTFLTLVRPVPWSKAKVAKVTSLYRRLEGELNQLASPEWLRLNDLVAHDPPLMWWPRTMFGG